MDYFRELIDILNSNNSSPIRLSNDMSNACIRVIEHCEEIEKELGKKLSQDLLVKFNNYRTMLHFIVNGIIVDELCNTQIKLILMNHKDNS